MDSESGGWQFESKVDTFDKHLFLTILKYLFFFLGNEITFGFEKIFWFNVWD